MILQGTAPTASKGASMEAQRFSQDLLWEYLFEFLLSWGCGGGGGGWGRRVSPAAASCGSSRGSRAWICSRKMPSVWSDGSWSDCGSHDKPGIALGKAVPSGNALFPDIFHPDHLLFHEQFRDYQYYILADCILGITLFTYKILEINCLIRVKFNCSLPTV